MLNEGFDGIMTNLREELPRLKDLDRVIFGYFAMGFDATTISHLVNKSINTIYIRKSRIKAMIEEVNPVHKIQFLERLS
jgi:TnpA family transposase